MKTMRFAILVMFLFAPTLFGIGNLRSISPNSGTIRPTVATSFTITADTTSGYDLQLMFRADNTSSANSCAMSFASTQWAFQTQEGNQANMTPVYYASTPTSSNAECSVTVPTGGWTNNGNGSSTITITLTFASGYTGTKNIYWLQGTQQTTYLANIYPASMTSAGSINISNNTAPTIVSLSGIPANINYGTWFTASWTCRDADGWADLDHCRAIIGYGQTDAETCDVAYWPNSNNIGAMNAAQNNWQQYAVGTAVVLGNNHCLLDYQNSTATRSGTDVTVNARLSPLPPILTHPTINGYVYAQDVSPIGSGWAQYLTAGTVRSGPKLFVTSQH